LIEQVCQGIKREGLSAVLMVGYCVV